MATSHLPTTTVESPPANFIGVARLAVTLGVSAMLIFLLCWLGTFIAFSSPTHAYIGLFTQAPTQSIRALVEGGLWSLLFGLLSGLVIASLYNMLSRLDRR